MARYNKWVNEHYSIAAKSWVARCPECHELVESFDCISENYKYCPFCGSKMDDGERAEYINKEKFVKAAQGNYNERMKEKYKEEIYKGFYSKVYCDGVDDEFKDIMRIADATSERI